MTNETLTKRKRGGQPGNQNAKHNRGNPNPRNNLGHYIGRGAPKGNQYARKQPASPHEIFIDDYPEYRGWFLANANKLDTAAIIDEGKRDPVLYNSYIGLTVDKIVEEGLEFRYGCYTTPEHVLIELVRGPRGLDGCSRINVDKHKERLPQGC